MEDGGGTTNIRWGGRKGRDDKNASLAATQYITLNFIEPSIDQLYSEKDYPFIRA
jgi:hypothetical protein